MLSSRRYSASSVEPFGVSCAGLELGASVADWTQHGEVPSVANSVLAYVTLFIALSLLGTSHRSIRYGETIRTARQQEVPILRFARQVTTEDAIDTILSAMTRNFASYTPWALAREPPADRLQFSARMTSMRLIGNGMELSVRRQACSLLVGVSEGMNDRDGARSYRLKAGDDNDPRRNFALRDCTRPTSRFDGLVALPQADLGPPTLWSATLRRLDERRQAKPRSDQFGAFV